MVDYKRKAVPSVPCVGLLAVDLSSRKLEPVLVHPDFLAAEGDTLIFEPQSLLQRVMATQ